MEDMVDNSAEHKTFVPKPPVSSDRVAVRPPSRLVRFLRNNTLGVGALAAALGMSPVIVSGQAEDMVGGAKDAIHGAAGTVADTAANVIKVPDPQKDATEKVRKDLESKSRNFGDPVTSAWEKDPKTGKDVIVYEHGSWSDVPISGTVGVKTKNQPLIVRSEPSTDGKVVSAEELKKLGVDVNNVWMTRVVGGPYDANDPKDAGEEEWIKTTVKGRSFFTASKFANPDGQKELEIEASDGSGRKIMVPFTPIGRE